MSQGTSKGCGVLLEKLPKAERGPATKGTGRVWACWCLAIAEWDAKKEEKGHFHWERPHQGKGGPSGSPSSHSCTGGENQKAEPFHHQRPAGHPHPFLELWLLEVKVAGAEQEAPLGLTRRQPHPFPYTQPSPVGPREPERWGGWTAFPRIWPRAPSELGPEVDCFLWELASRSREEGKSDSSSEPLAEEYERWVTWRGWALNMPSWWKELVKIPEVEEFQELACRIWASFELVDEWVAWHRELLPGSPSTQMSLPEGFPVTARSKVPLPWYQTGAVKENSGLCTDPPVLGKEV